ncbi:hypothetical protein IGJ37_000033 [Enterococcus sp. AZ104]
MLNHQLCLEKSVESNKQITEGFTIEWGVIVYQFISFALPVSHVFKVGQVLWL